MDRIKSNMISYLAELWEKDTPNEWDYHWKNIIGMTEEEMKKYGLVREY